MAISTQPKYPKDLSLEFEDGTGTPVNLPVPHTRGDVKLTGLRDVLNEVRKTEARGQFIGAGLGARIYPTLSLSCFLTSFTAAAAPGPVTDFVLKRGAYSANISTLGTGRPYTIDITVTVEGTDYGDSADHTFTCTDCSLVSIDWEEGEDGMFVTMSFEVLGAVTGDFAVAEH